jgi:hypothetical protein
MRELDKPHSRHADRPSSFHWPFTLDEELSIEQAEFLYAGPEPRSRSKYLIENQHDVFLADLEHREQLPDADLEFELVHEHERYRQNIATVHYARGSVCDARVVGARERAGWGA